MNTANPAYPVPIEPSAPTALFRRRHNGQWLVKTLDLLPLLLGAASSLLWTQGGYLYAALGTAALVTGLVPIWKKQQRDRRTRSELLEFALAIESGDLTVRMRPDGATDVSLVECMNAMVRSYTRLLAKLSRSARELTSTANEGTANANQGDSSVRYQREITMSSAATLEQLSVSLSNTSDNAAEASGLADISTSAMQEGAARTRQLAQRIGSIGSDMVETNRKAEQLNQRSSEISGIVEIIAEIAAQTNLLALNAAIEAARAGEMGRGFAVVADEVRKLAERTRTSTVEIQDLIGSLQNDVSAVAVAIDQAQTEVGHGLTESSQVLEKLEDVLTQIGRTQTAVKEISEASREQSLASESLARDVEQVASLAERNEHLVHDNRELSTYLEQMSAQLGELIHSYRYE